MNSDKIRVSVIIKYVSDKQDKEITNKDGDEYTVLNQIKKLFGEEPSDDEEEDKETVLRLLTASKLSNEIMASALADANREDLFDEKVETIESIQGIINQIINNNQ